jgi:outer membrane biosynthesis protein TonB
MASDDTIRLPSNLPNMAPVPAGGPSGFDRGYSSLPDDNISSRIGIALAVSIGVNFLLLYGASWMVNKMTVTPPDRNNIIKSGPLEVVLIQSTPTPQPSPTPLLAAVPSPTPRPEEQPEPTPTPRRNEVRPTPTPETAAKPTPEPEESPKVTEDRWRRRR